MTPAAHLLAALEAAGFAVRSDGGKLVVGPASKLPPGWTEEVKEYRDDLLALVESRPVLEQLNAGAWSPWSKRGTWGW